MISYLIGDATKPECSGPIVIAHVCNNLGMWGAGFVLAVSNRWPGPEKKYRQLESYNLGTTQFVQVDEEIWVANMIAQNGLRSAKNPVPLSYESLDKCLIDLAAFAKLRGATVHMPRIGCGLAGGKWVVVESRIQKILKDVEVFVYELQA